MNTPSQRPQPGSLNTSVDKVRVWDPLVRLFHWSLVASFSIAYLTEDDLLSVHVWSGYIIMALTLIRIIWGFVGSRYARWSDFIKEPAEIRTYIQNAALFKANRHIGHNPAGGAMVIALLISLAATTLSGLAVYGGQELSGPLAPMFNGIPQSWAHDLEDIHETFANLTLFLVFLHLAGVAFASLQHRENLVRAMITGFKNTQEK